MAASRRLRWIVPVLVGVAFVTLPAIPAMAATADLSVTKSDSPDPVAAGSNLTYAIGVTNLTAADATTVALSDTLPANTTFVSLSSPAGWSCTTPAVGGTGSVNCSIPTLPASTSAAFTLVVNVNATTAGGR